MTPPALLMRMYFISKLSYPNQSLNNHLADVGSLDAAALRCFSSCLNERDTVRALPRREKYRWDWRHELTSKRSELPEFQQLEVLYATTG